MKAWKIAFFLLTAFSLTGCFNVNDEVWIEPDGSGRYESVIDLSEMYGFMMMAQEMEEESDSTAVEEEEKDPFDKMMDELFMAESADTVLYFRELIESETAKEGLTMQMLLDSLRNIDPAQDGMTEAEKQKTVSLLETVMDMKLRIQASKAEQMFRFNFIQPFSDINNLASLGDLMSEIQPFMNEGGAEEDDGMDKMMNQFLGGTTQLSLDGNTLRVRRTGMDLGELDEETQQQMQMMQMFMGGDEPYRMTIHFPGKVKKVSSEVATLADKNTVVIEIPQKDLFDPEKSIDVEIRFKGLKRK